MGKVHDGREILSEFDALHPPGNATETLKVPDSLLELYPKRSDRCKGREDVRDVINAGDRAVHTQLFCVTVQGEGQIAGGAGDVIRPEVRFVDPAVGQEARRRHALEIII